MTVVMRCVGRRVHEFQVGRFVVRAVVILVVDLLAGLQQPTQHALHHEAVLEHSPSR